MTGSGPQGPGRKSLLDNRSATRSSGWPRGRSVVLPSLARAPLGGGCTGWRAPRAAVSACVTRDRCCPAAVAVCYFIFAFMCDVPGPASGAVSPRVRTLQVVGDRHSVS